MQNTSTCLDQAMFIASESYSGSIYETGHFQSIDGLCDDEIVFAPAHEMPNLSAMSV